MNPPQRDWAGRNVWIVGASSGIGWSLAEALHARGARVFVSARRREPLQAFVDAHPGSVALPVDAEDGAAILAAAAQVAPEGLLDCVVYCAGYYRAVRATRYDLSEMQRHERVNYSGALHVLDAVLPRLLAQGGGHLSIVSSVAGFRGLPLSLGYGPTKAALINLAETLYLDLRSQGIGVSLINPGFVDTPLTAQNAFEMPALMQPAQAAQAILRGWHNGSFEIHFPRRFTWWMKTLRLLPFRLYQASIKRVTGM
ncbi:SDR family NAD(P)-dependent oxidoreductase [Ramlibacter rhizophilus]|uniref:SDR family NAD(P)-dependent oxidoreductase n=2 Tax=Ramlibacter rhizophilus TaxID=1781167 RepID=A0A4Z0BI55_9BURK|nr:SDR family NAD(P)-dependent oxidoreductase [Ramlibacter rhizophilus]